MSLFLCFFFFQAEDGIRDTSVTGVQTCALPITTANCAETQSCSCELMVWQDRVLGACLHVDRPGIIDPPFSSRLGLGKIFCLQCFLNGTDSFKKSEHGSYFPKNQSDWLEKYELEVSRLTCRTRSSIK